MDRQKGIWNPSWLLATLSVHTVLNGPYRDRVVTDGLWEYRYREGGSAGDNRKLQRARDLEVDIIYFREEIAGRYRPYYPVQVVHNDPEEGLVLLAAKEFGKLDLSSPAPDVAEALQRWTYRETRVRLHQQKFRASVISAYGERCAVCELPIASLLDAAHIDPDSSTYGSPTVDNGLSLCKLHHRAYDTNIMGISASGGIRVTERVLALPPSSALDHSIKAFHGKTIHLPSERASYPSERRLARRWTEFRASV